jgi:hypothetical protein
VGVLVQANGRYERAFLRAYRRVGHFAAWQIKMVGVIGAMFTGVGLIFAVDQVFMDPPLLGADGLFQILALSFLGIGAVGLSTYGGLMQLMGAVSILGRLGWIEDEG